MISISNQIELRWLRSFLVLSETLHYRKAAELLYISQSALSQQIKQLENVLGASLFDRTNRKVVLSRAGELFVREAKLIQKQLNDSLERWQYSQGGVLGQLKIGFVGSAMQIYLPTILTHFGMAHPKINFYLEELSNAEQIRALEKKEIDIGFMRSNMVSSDLSIKSVYRENFTLVLPEDHIINKDNFQEIGQLSEESFILFPNENSPMYFQQIQNLCAEHGFSPKISHRSIHGPTIFRLVENGMGISIVPNSLRDEYNYKIRFIELTELPYKTELFAVWGKHSDNPALANFLQML